MTYVTPILPIPVTRYSIFLLNIVGLDHLLRFQGHDIIYFVNVKFQGFTIHAVIVGYLSLPFEASWDILNFEIFQITFAFSLIVYLFLSTWI